LVLNEAEQALQRENIAKIVQKKKNSLYFPC